MTTAKLSLPEITESQSSKYVTHNEALTFLDALVQATIIDRDLTGPPGGESEGDAYIPASVATGDWASHEDDIAYYDGSSWDFHTPEEGWLIYIQDENLFAYYNGSAWVLLSSAGVLPSISGNKCKILQVNSDESGVEWISHPYDIGSSVQGKPGAGSTIFRVPLPRSVRFPSGLTNSQGVAGTAATGQSDFDIQKNGVSVGTMRFAAAGSVASFIMASATDFLSGDVLTVDAPNPQDATLSDIGFILSAIRWCSSTTTTTTTTTTTSTSTTSTSTTTTVTTTTSTSTTTTVTTTTSTTSSTTTAP